MLSYLRIRGLALLDDVELELSEGMNVLTGETGAGKSIIVEALALVRGARAKGATIRSGADAISVDAQVELDGPTAARVGGASCRLSSPRGRCCRGSARCSSTSAASMSTTHSPM
jgi:DNA repair protein RecN (Recombination protein N)